MPGRSRVGGVAYVDTSCLVAIAFGQPGAGALASRLATFDLLLAGNLLEAELRSAMSREGVPFEPRLLDRIGWVLPGRQLSTEISSILAAGYLRGADLWHVACALFLSPDPRELSFLTVDKTQGAVAHAVGFTVPDLSSSRS